MRPEFQQIGAFILEVIGFVLIWAATDVGRIKERVKPYSFEWFLQVVLIVIALLLIRYSV